MKIPVQKYSNEKIGYELLQYIDYLDDGTETTIIDCLIHLYDLQLDTYKNFYSKKKDFTLLKDSCIQITGYVFSHAPKINLLLDNSKYWKSTGLPEKIPFIVKHVSLEELRKYEIKKMEAEM